MPTREKWTKLDIARQVYHLAPTDECRRLAGEAIFELTEAQRRGPRERRDSAPIRQHYQTGVARLKKAVAAFVEYEQHQRLRRARTE